MKREREELVFHFPHYQGDAPHSAIIVGDLKLMKFYEDNRVVLFDLAKDLREQTDLSKKLPEEPERRHGQPSVKVFGRAGREVHSSPLPPFLAGGSGAFGSNFGFAVGI